MWLSPAIRVFLGFELKSHPGSEVRSFLSYWNPAAAAAATRKKEKEKEILPRRSVQHGKIV
jgi:hypothetical protein